MACVVLWVQDYFIVIDIQVNLLEPKTIGGESAIISMMIQN